MNFIVICSIFLVLASFWQQNHAALVGNCNTCNSNGVACLNETHFELCVLNDDEIYSCPNGQSCTGRDSICVEDFDIEPICYDDARYCSSCDAQSHIACIDEISYTFCCNDNKPNMESLFQCPDDHVCNLGSRQICTPRSLKAPSCPYPHVDHTTTISTTDITDDPDTSTDSISTTESITESSTANETTEDEDTTTTTTTPFPSDPNLFCGNRQSLGNFKDELDTTCKKYIYCYFIAGQYLGQRYTCEGYFDDVANNCQADKPTNCN